MTDCLKEAVKKVTSDLLLPQLYHFLFYKSRVQKLHKDVEELKTVRENFLRNVRYEKAIDASGKSWLESVDEVFRKHDNFKEDEDRDSEYVGCDIDLLPKWVIRRCQLSIDAYNIGENVNELLQHMAPRGEKFSHWDCSPATSTMVNYYCLQNEELKRAFLLYAQIGPEASIMDLVKCSIGMDFIGELYSVPKARDKLMGLLAKLRELGLLSDINSSNRFTMQGDVRFDALSIASEEKHTFTLINGKLDEWPDKDKLKRYTSIFLQHCDINELFHETIDCPSLRLLHVDNNDSHLKMPKNFLKGMKELRALVLTGFHLSQFPSSIRFLTKLKLLCLEGCILGERLQIIGEMKKLRVLSFSGSDIENFPKELARLGLQILDISDCSKLKKIPYGVISRLISLEELYMGNTFIQWEIEGPTNQGENASLSELSHLKQLKTLDIQIPDVSHLPNNLFFDRLHSYKIVIGDLNSYSETDFKMPEKYEASRCLVLHLKDGPNIHFLQGIKLLFERVKNLFLEDLRGVQDILYELNLKGFPDLKHLTVSNSDIQSLINPKESNNPEKVFPELESLCLYDLKNLNKICYCKLSTPSFGKLKVIKIKLCGQLQNVFDIDVVGLCNVLETIEVSECKSLKKIVSVGRMQLDNEIGLLPQLRSLRLQSLFELKSFSSYSTKLLFHDKVMLTNLERLELSSMPISQIWCDRPWLIFYFRNLKHLDVNDCWNLRYLWSYPMAMCLKNLESLSVSKCQRMDYIFPQLQGQDNDAKMKQGGIFPNLKEIRLSSLKSLIEIWNPEIPLDSFGKLNTLIIEGCDKLVNVFPRYMVGIFQSLCYMKVTNCKVMKAIYNLGEYQEQHVGHVTKLQDIHFEALPNLQYVWKWEQNQNQQGKFNLKNLRSIWIHKCDNLETVFPFSTPKFLENLECLVIWDCIALRSIIEECRKYTLEFSKLTTIKLSLLPKLSSFLDGNIYFPALIDLSVDLQDELKQFRKEGPLFHEEVMKNLKSLRITSPYSGNYRVYKVEQLLLSRFMKNEIPFYFLYRNPNLTHLSLSNCFFEELVPPKVPCAIESVGVVPELKSLELIDLPYLKKLGFEKDTTLQRIEVLIIKNCPCLVTTVPFSVSFSRLKRLEVVNCNGLINLMSAWTAKSLDQLISMKIVNCEFVEEIVSEEGNEEDNAAKIDIVFRQLEDLELVSLKNLQSFCSSKRCAFEFPSLEKVVVRACPKMDDFSEEVKCSSMLQKLYLLHEEEKKIWFWEDNLKVTIQTMFKKKIYFEGMDELSVSDHVVLQQVWHGVVELQTNWFCSLETLKLENCDFEPYAIPSNVLPYLRNLKELNIQNCNNIEGIFDMSDMETTFQLKKLSLKGLKDLTHVWQKNNIFSFQNLQEVFVSGCDNLETLFSTDVALNFNKLEKLQIEKCDKFLQIVGNGEEETETSTLFSFINLTSLQLSLLPRVTYSYHEKFILECPELSSLSVFGCGKLDMFPQRSWDQGTAYRESLTSELKTIYKLEKLALDWKQFPLLWNVNLPNLKELHLFFDEIDGVDMPYRIMETASSLDRMHIYDCRSLNIFDSCHHYYSLEWNLKPRLKALILTRVFEMQSIGSVDLPWLNIICDNLHELYVFSCPRLTRFVNPEASFSCLKKLQIEECHGLEYLFISFTAVLFKSLEELYVMDCKSLKTIVVDKEYEGFSNMVRFPRLEKIALKSLSSLECFSTSKNTLRFPSLIKMVIQECPRMKIFSQECTSAERFRGIQASNEYLFFLHDFDTTLNQFLLQSQDVMSTLASNSDNLEDEDRNTKPFETLIPGTRESCAHPDPVKLNDGLHLTDKYLLSGDEPCAHVVAKGDVYDSSTVHNLPIPDGSKKVMVVEEIPKSHKDVTLKQSHNMGQLVKHSSDKDVLPQQSQDPALVRVYGLMFYLRRSNGSVVLNLNHDVTGLSKQVISYIGPTQIEELCCKKELDITVLQSWILYLHSLCVKKDLHETYGFMNPTFIRGDKQEEEIQTYIQDRLCNSNHQIYLAPCLQNKHWQLIVLNPSKSSAIIFCSMGWEPSKDLKEIVNTAMSAYQVSVGGPTHMRKNTEWIKPNCAKQPGSAECGYYVMRHMFTIVSEQIKDDWLERFNDDRALSIDEFDDIRERWSSFILELPVSI